MLDSKVSQTCYSTRWGHWNLLFFHSGILMSRTYVISNQNRWVAAVLGVLLVGSIIPTIVCGCTCIAHCEADILQLEATIDSCHNSIVHLKLIDKCVFQDLTGAHRLTCSFQRCEPSRYPLGWPKTSLSENTIECVFVLLFDTIIVVVTLYHILETWRLQRRINSMQKTLICLIMRQGQLFPCVLYGWK